eukprot:216489-Pelagomonas_calceolata.AAC.6
MLGLVVMLLCWVWKAAEVLLMRTGPFMLLLIQTVVGAVIVVNCKIRTDMLSPFQEVLLCAVGESLKLLFM